MASPPSPPPEPTKFKRHYENLIFLAAPRATITVGSYDAEYQVCQIGFGKRDGTLFVSFPYFPKTSGLLSVATMPPASGGSLTLSLHEHGKVTTHLVKFSHHPDGRAHFSQDGKVYTAVKRQSFPLNGPIGHVFWLHIYYPYGLKPFDQEKRDPKRAYLRNIFTPALPQAVTVAAEWRRKAEVVGTIHPAGHLAGPLSDVKTKSTGHQRKVFFFGPPEGYPGQDHVLLISTEATLSLPNITEPQMIFLGGFDHHEVPDPNVPANHTGCLAFIYPAENYEDLLPKLGSVDFMPG